MVTIPHKLHILGVKKLGKDALLWVFSDTAVLFDFVFVYVFR